MLYPSINKIRKKADSRYTLVILAAKRARDLIDGKPALTDTAVNQPVSIAAHEIAEDLITYSRDESAMDNAKDASAQVEEPVE
jgi:DNA-directed RNA polymerase subunit omega